MTSQTDARQAIKRTRKIEQQPIQIIIIMLNDHMTRRTLYKQSHENAMYGTRTLPHILPTI